MSFVQNDIVELNFTIEEQILNQDSVGHVANPSLIRHSWFHANMVAYLISHSAFELTAHLCGQATRSDSPGLTNCNDCIGVRFKDKLRDLRWFTAASFATNDGDSAFLNGWYNFLFVSCNGEDRFIVHKINFNRSQYMLDFDSKKEDRYKFFFPFWLFMPKNVSFQSAFWWTCY